MAELSQSRKTIKQPSDYVVYVTPNCESRCWCGGSAKDAGEEVPSPDRNNDTDGDRAAHVVVRSVPAD
jgi:hypothetical protein